MSRRKEDQQKFLSDSKSSNHLLHHPHYRPTSKATHSTKQDSKNQFETHRINRKTLSVKVPSSYRFNRTKEL